MTSERLGDGHSQNRLYRDAAFMKLADALVGIAPKGSACRVLRIDQAAALWPEEGSYTQNVAPKRKREFRAGRAAARAALEACGLSPQPILRDKARRPIWPPGFVGSISHTDHLAAAIAGDQSAFAGLGLDIVEA